MKKKVAGVNDVKYTVAVTADAEKGTVELDKTQVALGETAVATVTAKEGWAAAKVEFNGVKLTPNAEGKYEFTGAIYTNSLVVEFAEDIQYDITINTPEKGTAELSATKAKIGTEITITVSPAEGYEIDYVKVNGESIRAVDGAYKFRLNGTTSVEVAFKLYVEVNNETYTWDKVFGVDSGTSDRLLTMLGCKVLWKQNSSNNKIKLDSDEQRIYVQHSLTFTANERKSITKIVLHATTEKFVLTMNSSAVGNDGSTKATVTEKLDSSALTITYEIADGASSVTLVSSKQVRISSFEVFYA